MPRLLLIAPVLFVLLLIAPSQAQDAWPEIALTQVAGGFTQPIYVSHAGDGTNRLFVVERAGRIRTIDNGQPSATTFLDIRSRVQSSGSEQGLLGLAFPPGYATKGHFYVYYTRRSDNANVIARYRITSADAANPDSEQVILAMADPYANHNGGVMLFGPNDGYLYVGTGDGGSAGDPGNRAQNPSELLGKILRLDVEAGGDPYTVPTSNPDLGGRREVWALGLRNPWRFSFDRANGDLWIGDVGQGQREEIDRQPASSRGGENYGWRLLEGTRCYNPTTNCDPGGLVAPVAEYDHSLGCSVTGGYVYRGTVHERMRGTYFYGDYCSGRIWGLRADGQGTLLLESGRSISSFGEDEAGELYLTDLANGRIYRVTDAAPATATPQPVPTLATGWARSRAPLAPRNAGVG